MREREQAKDEALTTFVQVLCGRGVAARHGISPSALMRVRWVVTLKEGGQLKVRLVVQGVIVQRLDIISNSIPSVS